MILNLQWTSSKMLMTPKDGKLEAFAPVVANILRNWIAA
ncbi:hypothetical protein AEST_01070 [Alishewanella aestuarii B11]|uniref:Uncharacterized protein n=1 Tax=Alishewanella aestuarii B11 TaxID=1197174 RepID=J1QN75_9ALTE|nr:hypothetical protein AEST_01070 [Alishewanella aestuarii B11]